MNSNKLVISVMKIEHLSKTKTLLNFTVKSRLQNIETSVKFIKIFKGKIKRKHVSSAPICGASVCV